MSTGSLGTGFSATIGMALAAKLDKRIIEFCYAGGRRSSGRTSVEAAMAASHYKLDNLIAVLDYNGTNRWKYQ